MGGDFSDFCGGYFDREVKEALRVMFFKNILVRMNINGKGTARRAPTVKNDCSELNRADCM